MAVTPPDPPDPTGLEAWIRQVLGLAGARASVFAPPLPHDQNGVRPAAEAAASGQDAARSEEEGGPDGAG